MLADGPFIVLGVELFHPIHSRLHLGSVACVLEFSNLYLGYLLDSVSLFQDVHC
jgi:hypothetical protein